jgi:acyl-CoA thioesterase
VGDPEQAHSTFGAALALERAGDSFHARVPAGWSQGRATFGGLVLSLALRAARQPLPEPRPARGLVAVFPAPIAPGDVELHVRELRHGRAVSHVQVEVRQQGVIGCVLLASFGAARSSALGVTPEPAPPAAPPERLPGLVPARGERPEFTGHLDYRLAFGTPPYAGAEGREIGGWCRFRHEPGPLGEEHVLALVDAWPSPAVSRMPVPAPASSITWSIELLAIEPAIPADGWWLYRAELEASADGYAHSSARLWSPAGRLAALSRQAVAVFG